MCVFYFPLLWTQSSIFLEGGCFGLCFSLYLHFFFFFAFISKWSNNNFFSSQGRKQSLDPFISCFSCPSIMVPLFISDPSTRSPENQVLFLIVYIKFKWIPPLPTCLLAPVYGSLTVMALLHRLIGLPAPRTSGRSAARTCSRSGDAFDETIKRALSLSLGKCCVSGAAMNQPQGRGSGWSRLRRVSEISPGVLHNKGPDRQVPPSLDQSIGCRTSGA